MHFRFEFAKLNELQRDPNLVGWIRSDSIEATSPAVSEELARLSRENDLLRKQVANTNDCIGAIPFETIKDMLFEDEQMINVFWNMAEDLLGGGVTAIGDEDESKLLVMLLELNLVIPDRKPDGAIYYSFNDNGRRFVSRNKLQFFEEDNRANSI